ncbi:MAG: hypothetical protein MUD17_07330 [Gemmatimonadaceae bacterium]|jgi:hypothetical protein|nr:hypothetical protein [Gemmatimonadaceae bacterium]
MSRTTPWLALLLVATTACSDGEGLVDTPLNRQFDEAFTMSLPAFRPLTVPTSETAPPPGTTLAASSMLDPSEIPPEYQERMQGGLITVRSWADAGFASDHDVAYGMGYGRSRGNYYRNHVRTVLRYRGSHVASVEAEESEWSFVRLPVFDWGETAVANIGVTSECGHQVDALSRHEAELRLLAPTRLFTILQESSSGSATAAQPACSSGGGSGGSGSEGEWYICYWIDHYDSEGNFIFRQDLGCTGINMQ